MTTAVDQRKTAAKLSPNQKATVDLSHLRAKLTEFDTKARKWVQHDKLDKALHFLEQASAYIGKAVIELATLEPEYKSHPSAYITSDIEVGNIVTIRDRKRPKYAAMIPESDWLSLKVVSVGKTVVLALPSGTQVCVTRGDVVTAPVYHEDDTSLTATDHNDAA